MQEPEAAGKWLSPALLGRKFWKLTLIRKKSLDIMDKNRRKKERKNEEINYTEL